MLNSRQEILLKLCCACLQNDKYTLRDVFTFITTDDGYLEAIADCIESERDYFNTEEKIDNQEKSKTNYSY